ncbi:MAG: DNA replication/repair protein RecF [Clostridiaceae bacterium]|nr:DNA replication/repair protein RecF [Clostridiaceae bacterium]
MIVKSLTLTNFRNYVQQTVEFDNGINIIHGKNGQGKTNILESIFMCSAAKSPRTSNFKEMVNMDTNDDFFVISMDYSFRDMDSNIKIKYDNRGKTFIYNDIVLDKVGELMTRFLSILFTPEDLYIIKGGPECRRRFLDMFICQVDKGYFYLLQKYNRLLKQKSSCLKADADSSEKETYIHVLNDYMADIGSKVIDKRLSVLREMKEKTYAIHKNISNGLEEIDLNYVFSGKKIDDHNVKETMNQKLDESLEKELLRKVCLVGPHRDDIEIRINEKDARTFGSQGQIRTAALSLKLCQADIMEKKCGEKPVVLLDDVLSELDIGRQRAIVEKFQKNQIIITCTDKEKILENNNGSIRYIFVQKGKIIV